MANEETKYYMGDVFQGDVSIGFLVSDERADGGETTIDEATARAIVSTSADADPNGALKPANLFDISQEEFERFRDAEIPSSSLPDGVKAWQVKR